MLDPAAGPRLGKAQRKVLQRYLDELIHSLLDVQGPAEDELSALLRKHTGEDIAALREQQRQFDKDLAEAMLGGIFGDDVVQGHQADNSDDLFNHVADRLHERERELDRARRPRTKRAQAAAERRAQAEREASQSVREVFRKLASSLHPDRESDATQRAHKTGLMQRVTRAYQDNDLLALLTLQMQIEQIDTEHLSSLPEARLRHYNAVLRDQLKALDDEIAALVAPAAMEMNLPDTVPRRRDLERALNERIAMLQQWQAETAQEIAALDDSRRRNTLAAQLQARFRIEDAEARAGMADPDPFFDLFELFEQAAQDMPEDSPPRGGRRPGRTTKPKKRGTKRR